MGSRKKATMTLKDFHGGSIPSDLPLPSAPGVTVRPMDRPVFDRPNPWGNPMGRQDHRLRPGSAGSVRNNFDDKTPFLGPNAHIGRNFDEDERKPLDGGPGPRRPVSDDSFRSFPARTDVAKFDHSSTYKQPLSQQFLSADVANPNYSASFRQPPSQQFSGAVSSTYAGRVSEATHGGPRPNVWAMRKESVSVAEVSHANWSGPDAALKLAHASALDKVSSGRWQSNKQTINHLANVEPVGHSEIESGYHSADVAGGMECLTLNDRIQGGEEVIPSYEKATMYPGKTEDISYGGKFVGSVMPSLAPPEQSERPKLKLLPRSKPLNSSEPSIDHNQEYHQSQNSEHVHQVTKPYVMPHNTASGSIVADSGNLAVERPKLNLKQRAQALEQVEVTIEKGRNTVFGGARPRELVLKERGVDDIVINNHDVVQPPTRVKQDLPRTEIVSPRLTRNRYNEGTYLDSRAKKNNDNNDNRLDAERTDTQKRNWRSENQRSTRETGIKHQPHQQQPRERPPSPDTWRKPVEEPRPPSSDGTGLRYGKAASAVELAQAFSKSASDPKIVEPFSNQRGIPRMGQIPFSRLTDPASRSRINGY